MAACLMTCGARVLRGLLRTIALTGCFFSCGLARAGQASVVGSDDAVWPSAFARLTDQDEQTYPLLTGGISALSDPTYRPVGRDYPSPPSTGEVIRESIFGPASKSSWKPLSLSTFFSEGWNRPFTNAPEGTNGAPKQFWVDTASGVFSRSMRVDFFYTNQLQNNPGLLLNGEPWSPVHPKDTTGNQYTAAYAIFVPLSSRFEVQIIAPFLASNKLDATGPYQGNFGDLSFQARFHLIEQRNFSVVGLLGERTPTGNYVNGNNLNLITPSLEGWWNFAPKWVMRGSTGINVRTNRVHEYADIYFNKFAVGRYVTDKHASVFKDLALYGTATVLSDVSGQARHVTDLYLGPGLRFGVGKQQKGAFSAAVQVPVTGPQTYVWQPNFSFIMKY